MNHNCSNAPRYIALKGGLCGLTLFCRCISLCFEIKLQRHQKTSIIMTYNIFSSYLIGCGFTTTGINLTWHPIFVLYIFISSTETVFFLLLYLISFCKINISGYLPNIVRKYPPRRFPRIEIQARWKFCS